MEGVSGWAILRGIFSIGSKLLPRMRRLRQERLAGEDPYSVPPDRAEPLLDNALKRLGAANASDSLWAAIGVGLEAA
jgi:hypothetical protein